MVKLMRSISLGLLAFALYSCSGAQAEKQAIAVKKGADTGTSANSTAGHTLSLSWDAQSSVSQFHIFYVDPQNKAREIDSLPKADAKFLAPELTVNDKNMETWPAAGSKACFYVVADASGVMSDASDSACIVL